MTAVRYRMIDSPLGVLTVAGEGQTLTRLSMDDQAHAPAEQQGRRDDRSFPDVVEQLGAYFDGELVEFDVTVRLDGTAFQKDVWSALGAIPYGATVSYGEVARRVGRPGASRAVGLASGRNPIAIIVPCHRVIGSSGGLVGYGGGLDRKRLLLDLERARVAAGSGAAVHGASAAARRAV